MVLLRDSGWGVNGSADRGVARDIDVMVDVRLDVLDIMMLGGPPDQAADPGDD